MTMLAILKNAAPTLEEIEAAQLAAQVNRQAGVRLLAGAILKIAPEAAAAIAKRWEEVQHSERLALDEFLKALRSPETQSGEST